MARCGGGAGRLRLKALLLAAGAGRRFGGGKLTAPYAGRPLLTHALDAALAAPVEVVVMVTGFHAQEVLATAQAHAGDAFAKGRLCAVHAEDAVQGLGASLRVGAAAAGEADGLFVFLADMPDIPHHIAQRLAAALAQDEAADAAAPTFQGGRGHPVLFSSRLSGRLGEARGDRGAADLLAGPDVRLLRVPVDDAGVLRDVDTPQALAQTRLDG